MLGYPKESLIYVMFGNAHVFEVVFDDNVMNLAHACDD